MKKRISRPENWWCISSGSLLLPFTARTTRKQAIQDWVRTNSPGGLRDHKDVVKVIVGRASEGSWRPARGPEGR